MLKDWQLVKIEGEAELPVQEVVPVKPDPKKAA